MCGDYHEIEKVGHSQAQQVAQLLVDRACKDDHIIVEDLNDLSALEEDMLNFLENQREDHIDQTVAHRAAAYIQNLYKEYELEREYRAGNGDNSLLFLVPYFAKKHNISCKNIDFRQLFTSDAPHLPLGENGAESRFICWLLNRVIAGISASCTHGEQEQKVAQFKPFMEHICSVMQKEQLSYQQLPTYFSDLFLTNPDAYDADTFLAASTEDFLLVHGNLNDIVSRIKKGDSSDAIKNALMTMLNYIFELSMIELIDITILDHIVEKQINCDTQNALFVCVGEAHMEAVETDLPSLGYKKVDMKIDEDGVDLESFCKPYLLDIAKHEKGALWHYITDLFRTVVSWFA